MSDTDFGFRPDEAIQNRKEQRKQKLNEAESLIKKAREAEKNANPDAMSAEDRALYFYLRVVVTILEQDYDILIEQ